MREEPNAETASGPALRRARDPHVLIQRRQRQRFGFPVRPMWAEVTIAVIAVYAVRAFIACTASPSMTLAIRVGLLIPFPMGCRIQILSGTEHAAFGSVAEVHGIVLQRKPQEGAVFRDQVIVVDPSACHCENNEIVLNRLRVRQSLKRIVLAVAVQGIGHFAVR